MNHADSATRTMLRQFTLAAAAAAMAVGAGAADASDRTWFGGTGNWADAAGWSPAIVPTASDRAIFTGGSSIVSVTSAQTVGALRMAGGLLRDSASVTVSGLTEISGNSVIGGYGGDLVANGGLVIDTTFVYSTGIGLGGPLGTLTSGIVNNGTGVIKGSGYIANSAFGRLVNGSSGTLDLQGDIAFYGGSLVNRGAIFKSAGAANGSSEFRAAFDNAGSVLVQQGRLTLSYGGNHGGSFATSADGWVEFAGGYAPPPHVLLAGAGATGNVRMTDIGGTLKVMPGATYDAMRTELVFIGTLDVAAGAVARTSTLYLQRGGFSGGGDLVVSGLTELFADNVSASIGGQGGNIVANGGLRISGDFGANLGVSAGAQALASGIVNNGVATWSGNGGFSAVGNGRFVNSAGASLDLQSDADFGGGSFVNRGLLVKSAGAGGTASSNFNTAFTNTGTVRVERGTFLVGATEGFTNDGTVAVLAGAVFSAGGLPEPFGRFVNRGTMLGNGTIVAAHSEGLRNSGLIAPGLSVGLLTIDGDLHTAGSGVLQFELATTASFDRLAISDDASFGGTIEVVNLGYVPALGDRFVVITHDLRLAGSTFDALHAVGFEDGVAFGIEYNLHDVTLVVTTVVPEPATWALWLAAGAAALARRRTSRAREPSSSPLSSRCWSGHA